MHKLHIKNPNKQNKTQDQTTHTLESSKVSKRKCEAFENFMNKMS